MPFDGREFLDAAQRLALHTDQESCTRSAISRSYYACYWVARAYCRRNQIAVDPPHGETAHRFLQDQLMNNGLYKVASQLVNLCDRRVDADYEVHYPAVLAKEVTNVIKDAEDLIALIDALD